MGTVMKITNGDSAAADRLEPFESRRHNSVMRSARSVAQKSVD
jgi:hypothetical protein